MNARCIKVLFIVWSVNNNEYRNCYPAFGSFQYWAIVEKNRAIIVAIENREYIQFS